MWGTASQECGYIAFGGNITVEDVQDQDYTFLEEWSPRPLTIGEG